MLFINKEKKINALRQRRDAKDRSKTHKKLKERFLIGRNRTKRANFVLFRSIKKRSFNLLCVLDLFFSSERWQSTLFLFFFFKYFMRQSVADRIMFFITMSHDVRDASLCFLFFALR